MVTTNNLHTKNITRAGKPLDQANKALILVHGRGGSAEDILSLAAHLPVNNFALLAPEATNNAWYPKSFIAPVAENEPWLSSAINVLQELVTEVVAAGIPRENIYFAGFSQGACLTLEFVTRNAVQYGGIAAFTGGLIGEQINTNNYVGDFEGTPVFIGTSDPDPHVSVHRVHATTQVLQSMHARVTEKVYPDMGHTISQEELELAGKVVFGGKE